MSTDEKENEEMEWKTTRSFTQTWCNTLIANLKVSFSSISSSFDEINTSIRDLNNNVLSFNDNLQKKINEVSEIAQSNTAAISDLRAEVTGLHADITEVANICMELKRENSAIREENSALKDQHVNMETYSRRENLIFYGIKEERGESNVDCAKTVRAFFRTSLQLTDNTINLISFERCHRLKNEVRGTRPIIVRFSTFRDRELVWSKASSLKGKFPFSMSEDFPREITFRRNKLYPIFKKAKGIPNLSKQVTLRGDKLNIVGKQYTVDTLHTLTGALSPRTMSERSNDNVYVCGGIYSDANPLTNLGNVPIK